MFRLEPLSLDHQLLLSMRFKNLAHITSEYVFANLYLFRQVHAYQVLFAEDIYVTGRTRDGFSFVMPTSSPDRWQLNEIRILLEQHAFFFPIPEEWLSFFPADQYTSTHQDGDSDYLYAVEKLSRFPGRHLSGRRNLLKQFKEHYSNTQTVPLTIENREDAKELLEKWQSHAPQEAILTDYQACKEAIELFEKLRLRGRLTYVDKTAIGIVLGEPLTGSTYVLHFAKGLIEYKGVYQYLYNEYAKLVENKYRFINLEQDLGSAELAHSKKAYLPDRKLLKKRVSLKK